MITTTIFHITTIETCLTNRMGFISRHITPLVIKSLGGGHTHTHKHTHIQISTQEQFQETRRAPATGRRAWFKKLRTVFQVSKIPKQLTSKVALDVAVSNTS